MERRKERELALGSKSHSPFDGHFRDPTTLVSHTLGAIIRVIVVAAVERDIIVLTTRSPNNHSGADLSRRRRSDKKPDVRTPGISPVEQINISGGGRFIRRRGYLVSPRVSPFFSSAISRVRVSITGSAIRPSASITVTPISGPITRRSYACQPYVHTPRLLRGRDNGVRFLSGREQTLTFPRRRFVR